MGLDLLYGRLNYNLTVVLLGDAAEYQYVIGKKDTESFLDPRFHTKPRFHIQLYRFSWIVKVQTS